MNLSTYLAQFATRDQHATADREIRRWRELFPNKDVNASARVRRTDGEDILFLNLDTGPQDVSFMACSIHEDGSIVGANEPA